jgi:hypothetical protein
MSCLFNSMSRLFPTNENPQEIRNKICDYLAANPHTQMGLSVSEIIHTDSGSDINTYVQQMRSPCTWGGAIEIAAATELWSCSFYVKVERTGKWIEFLKEGTTTKYGLSWTGGHYEPLDLPENL